MKKFFLITLFFFTSLLGENLKTYNLQEALELSLKQNKLLIVEVYIDNCQYCKKMDREVFENFDVIQKLNSETLFVKLNRDKDNLDNRFFAPMVPTFFFLIDNKIVKKIPGSWSIKDFLGFIESAKANHE